MSTVNFIEVWTLFKASMKEYNSSRVLGHIMKMSSIYPHQTSGTGL